MSFEEFMVYANIESFKTDEKSFDEAYPEMIRVEAKLYGVDDKKYINIGMVSGQKNSQR